MSARFHRTLKDAFPSERFAAIEIGRRHARYGADTVVVVAVVVAIVAVVLMASWGWL